jgi:YD repeat-containing protein
LEYDAVGNYTAKVDRREKRTEFEYNCLNQLVKTIGPLNKITRYTYDEMGNRSSVTDANNNTTRYSYDLMGRLIVRLMQILMQNIIVMTVPVIWYGSRPGRINMSELPIIMTGLTGWKW